MANKVNPLLAKYEAKIAEAYNKKLAQIVVKNEAKLQMHFELDLIAYMLVINEDLGVGNRGRSDKMMNDYLAWQVEIAEAITDDCKDDPETLHTRRDLAVRLKSIFGKSWEKNRELFPSLREYW